MLETRHILQLQSDPLGLDCFHPETDRKALGTRYNHSGYLRQITLGGQELLGQPRSPFDPFHGCGFPDEFETPLAYEHAALGECFIKIGVGLLRKTANRDYTNWDRHPLIEPPEHRIETTEQSLVFTQSLHAGSFRYTYEKSVHLEGEVCVVSHRLENQGRQRIETEWYSHIFLDVTHWVRPSLTLPKGSCPRSPEDLAPEGDCYRIPRDYTPAGACHWWLMDAAYSEYHRIDSREFSMEARGDYPPSGFMLYRNKAIFSPEPRLRLSLPPGSHRCWATTYRFEKHHDC
jgi:hypothetical protein